MVCEPAPPAALKSSTPIPATGWLLRYGLSCVPRDEATTAAGVDIYHARRVDIDMFCRYAAWYLGGQPPSFTLSLTLSFCGTSRRLRHVHGDYNEIQE